MEPELTYEQLSEPAKPRSQTSRLARPGVLVVLIAVLVGAAFFFYNFQFVIVSGGSMLPTLKDQQRLLICKALWALGPPTRGDIVVVDTPDGFIIKRVAYLAGDEIEPDDRPFEWPLEPKMVVPSGSVYVLGDNRPESEDSRAFGPIKLDRVVGKVIGLK